MFEECLERNAKIAPSKKKFVYDNQTLTNEELYQNVFMLLDFFLSQGLLKKKILVEYTNEINIIPLLFASLIIGNNMSLIDLRTMNKSKDHIYTIFKPDILVKEEIIFFESEKHSFQQIYSKPISKKQIDYLKDLDGEDEIVLTIFTSGSTGQPKGVQFRRSNILFCMRSILNRLEVNHKDKIGLFLPITFDYGLYHIFFSVYADCTLFFFTNDFSEFELVKFIAKCKISFLPSLPKVTINLLWLVNKTKNIDISSLKTITNTGEYLDPSIQKLAWKINTELNIYFMYGITECKRVSILTPEDYKKKPESVGKPISGVEVYLLDKNKQCLKQTGMGELVVSGLNVSIGYLNDPYNESFFSIEEKEYFRTGDLFYIDKEGFLYFKGRISGFIKSNGYRIDPLEIERVVLSVNQVFIAKLLEIEGSAILVYQGEALISDIYRELNRKLDSFKVPKIRRIKNMPLTSNGKIDLDMIKREIMDN